MDDNSQFKVKRIIWLSLFLILFFVAAYNLNNLWMLVFLSGLLVFSFTIRNIIIYPSKENTRADKLIRYIEVFLVMLINYFDSSDNSQAYYYVLIADASLDYSYLFGGGITVFCFLFSLINQHRKINAFSNYSSIPGVILNAFMFFVFYGIICFAKYEMDQRKMVSKMMYELKKTTKQLEDTYIKLRDNTREIEEMTILKERNRIAREIHDTMGHTLTSVLIELEAGERLLELDPEIAAQKIHLAKGQVRKGLNDIRESVGILNQGKELLGFVPSMELLLKETASHGDIYVKFDISELPPLTEMQENALYRALQEGLTNGIKHGKSTAFVFILNYKNGTIDFQLQDNGIGCDNIVFGFGLAAMEQRIRGIGGTLNISSTYGEGCTIHINISVNKGGVG